MDGDRRGALSRRLTPPLWLGLGLVVIGFAAIAIFVAPGDLDGLDLPPEFADEPDAYLEDGVISQYRADGSLHYRLWARRAAYFERDNFTRLSAPVLELHNPQGPPWRVESATGDIRVVAAAAGGDEEQVNLRGDVKLSQRHQDGAFTEVRTESLTLYPERQYASAELPVMITTETSRATAAGFEADLQSGHMRLFSSARQRVTIGVQPEQFK